MIIQELSLILTSSWSNYIFNYWDINLISFFNHGIMYFILNVYLGDQQTTLKYLKYTEVNLNNILIMIEDFNIRDRNWNLLYCCGNH